MDGRKHQHFWYRFTYLLSWCLLAEKSSAHERMTSSFTLRRSHRWRLIEWAVNAMFRRRHRLRLGPAARRFCTEWRKPLFCCVRATTSRRRVVAWWAQVAQSGCSSVRLRVPLPPPSTLLMNSRVPRRSAVIGIAVRAVFSTILNLEESVDT